MWRRWGAPQNFCLAFSDELEKQLLLKKMLKKANKKCKNFNIYNTVFFKKNKEKHLEISLFYTCVLKSWWYDLCSWDIECDRLKLVIMGLFLPFFPLKPPKNQNFEKVKKIAGDIIILHKFIKNHGHEVRFLRYGVRQADFFALLLNWKIKILKKWKKHLKM